MVYYAGIQLFIMLEKRGWREVRGEEIGGEGGLDLQLSLAVKSEALKNLSSARLHKTKLMFLASSIFKSHLVDHVGTPMFWNSCDHVYTILSNNVLPIQEVQFHIGNVYRHVCIQST